MDDIKELKDFYTELEAFEKELDAVNSKINTETNSKVKSSYVNFLNKINACDTNSSDVRAVMTNENNSKKNPTNEEADQDPYYAKIEDPTRKIVNDII